jgi:hypothetical protein
MTSIGLVGDVLPYLARVLGRRMTKSGLGTSPIGAEEQAWDKSMRLGVENPTTGRVEMQSPRPTLEWTTAASNEVKLIGDRSAKIAQAASEGPAAPKFDVMRLNKVVEDDIKALSEIDVITGGPQATSEAVRDRLQKVLGIKWSGGMGGRLEGEPIDMNRLYQITRNAGDYAGRMFRARLAAAQEGKALPDADATEIIAKKVWAEGKAMMSESGPAGQAIAANADRQFRLIQINELMKRAGKSASSVMKVMTPRSAIPTGAKLFEIGMGGSPTPYLQAATAPLNTTPVFNALNPPRAQ